MDRSWILKDDRVSKEYLEGIKSFLTVARAHLNKNKECRCPCRSCVNRYYVPFHSIRIHLMRFGFSRSYDVWICHGEKETAPSSFLTGNNNTTVQPETNVTECDQQEDDQQDDEQGDNEAMRFLCEDLVGGGANNDAEQPFDNSDKYNFLGDNTEKLYEGCKYSSLEVVIRLLHIKVMNRWTDKSFDLILKFINLVWTNLKRFPSSTYEAKKRLREVGLGYEKIDVCRNDCSLFWKDHANDENCHVCAESRYKDTNGKGKKIPWKMLRYLRLTSRLVRIFGSRHTASDMRWHNEIRDSTSDALRHPADGEAWKEFDDTYPDFAADGRNVRLGLAADGFCPFTALYSMWPVILVPYNLPPWKCMQQQFRMLTLLIPGPTSPGKDIDVFLQPLIDELKDLWSPGVQTYDAASHTWFQMRACLLWTINDFPAYGNLSGWSTHGKMACPICLNNFTCDSITSKLCYMSARRYLQGGHPWRRSRLHNGKFEHREAPAIKNGKEILVELESLPHITFGKHAQNKDHKRKRAASEGNWTKKSVFFELPYWSDSKLPHNLDVMHIEKNVNDNVLYTLLDTDGRTKDTIKARIDLERIKIRKHLHIKKLPNGKVVKPKASYVLNAADKKRFLQFITSVKFPDGYAANLSRGINVKDGKIHGLKSHDCHVLFQRLIPIAIRGFLPKDVCKPLIEFSVFFQRLTSKSLRVSDLDELQDSIVMVLCKLERIFPPAFFDVMIHLTLHLVREARLGGPVNCRWMYPFERDMGVYKKYVRNRARPEGSIAEAYSIKEALTFCGMYFNESEAQFARHERNDDEVLKIHGTISVFSQRAKPFGGAVVEYWSKDEIEDVHWAILNNCKELGDFVNEHMMILEEENPETIQERHRERFSLWFEQRMKQLRMEQSPRATDEFFALSKKPNFCVHSYPGCIVNGVRFRTKERDELRNTQNCGISIFADHDEDEVDYYGHLSKVMVLDYIMDYKVVVFACEWYDTNPKKNMIRRDYHFKSVNINSRWYDDDPYILAIHAKQVFYVDDLKLGGDWRVVQEVEQRQVWDISEKEDTMHAELNCDAFQQNESSRIEFVTDPDDDPALPNDDQIMEDIELGNFSEFDLERLRQTPIGAENYELSFIDDDEDNDDQSVDYLDDSDDSDS